MTENVMNKKEKINKLTATGEFADFKIKSEKWTLHRISDNTILRSRVILSGVLLDKNLISKIETQLKTGEKAVVGLSFKTKQLFEVEPPTSLRGLPDSKAYSNQELSLCIVDEDMDFETMNQGWNTYELENGLKIKLRISIVAVHRTSKFDNWGLPVYIINSNVEAKTELPERLRKIAREKTKSEVLKIVTRAN